MKKIKLYALVTCTLLISLSTSGCQAQTPSDTIKLFLEEVKHSSTGDFSQLMDDATVSNQELAPEVQTKIHEITQQISYHINSEVIDGNVAIVNVTVNGPDLAKVLMEYENKIILMSREQDHSDFEKSEEGQQKINLAILLDALNQVQFFDRTADIKLKRTNDSWQIGEHNESLLYVLLNLQSAMLHTN